jgi:hypothetical protein
MKQISKRELRSLALRDAEWLRVKTEWAAADWLAENAAEVSKIELGANHKTLFGEWPKGWKAEMKRAAKEMAETAIIDAYRRDNIFELDGALWLRDPIEQERLKEIA